METDGLLNGMDRLLFSAFEYNASDVHLKAGAIPKYRVDGELRPVELPPTDTEVLEQLAAKLSDRSVEAVQRARHFEFSCQWADVGHFRGHYYRQRTGPALALRVIPLAPASFADLRLPPNVKPICDLTHGLVLVTGPTGMGKTTTLASMLDAIAKRRCRHIVTIEDPIEFVLEDGISTVAQREIGRHVESYSEGLRAALRQDPDVIFIGEIRDPETLKVALRAAMTGHLVLSSAHFSDATSTIDGIVAMSEEGKRSVAVRHQLAQALRAILSQRLLPRRGSKGRVLATELMFNTPTARACILEESKTRNLRVALGRAGEGTHTMDQSLLHLLEARLITAEVAQSAAVSPGDLMRNANLKRIPTD